jgi:hypothetical protein
MRSSLFHALLLEYNYSHKTHLNDGELNFLLLLEFHVKVDDLTEVKEHSSIPLGTSDKTKTIL